MGEFLTKLECTPIDDSDKNWVIDKPLIFRSDIIGTITVPAGFQTDLASVPRVPLFYMLYGGRAHHEGVVHDLLYRCDAAGCVEFIPGIHKEVSFSQANRVFLEAMEARHKSFFVRYGMTVGVFIGGWFSYHKKNVTDKLK
jgi:hypothetical protein